MATIWMEPTETGDMGPYTSITGSPAVSSTQVAGAWSARSLFLDTDLNTVVYALPSSYSTIYGQARIFTTSAFTGNGAEDIIGISSADATRQCSVGIDNGGHLVAYRGSGSGTALGSAGTTVLQPNRWYLLQYKMVISNTVGEIVIKLDGVTEVNVTSQDTQAHASDSTASLLVLCGWASNAYMDDVIINDTTGSVNNSYPDSLGIEALFPNAAGDNTGLTRGGADSGSNYGQVDERPANDATDYVYDTVVDDYDLYNIPTTQWPTVAAVTLAIKGQKSDAGTGNVAHMVKADTNGDATADTEYTGSDVALSTSWTYHLKVYDQQPDSTNWTQAKVNALQVGAKAR